MENKELEMILGILIILILPTMIGSLTNLIFKIKNNSISDRWYTGIWSLFFIMILVVLSFSTYTTVIKLCQY
jgi:predicted Na+-dependent transporter